MNMAVIVRLLMIAGVRRQRVSAQLAVHLGPVVAVTARRLGLAS